MAESAEAYIARRMAERSPRTISTFKKLQRAKYKAARIKTGELNGDDSLLDAYNLEVYMEVDKNKNISHYRTLHPTKGFQKRSKKRDIFIEVTNKAEMWKIIQHNLSRYTKGMKDEIIQFKHKGSISWPKKNV